MNRGILAATLFASLGLVGCIDGGLGHAFHESVDVDRPLSPNGRFSLENTNGSVRVATWDEPRVRIEAVKAAGSERALRDIEVAVSGEGDHVEVRSRMPRGHFFGRSGKVDYTVTVPRGASVSVHNVNGRIELQGVGGAVRAENVNGSLDATDLGGPVEASTVNGSVEVRMARVDGSGRNRVATTNGSVRVILPRDAAAEIEASTVNGAVHCDFDLDGTKSRRRVSGRIGGGGPRFELATVNGSANVDRGLSAAANPGAEHPTAAAKPPAEAEAPARATR